MILVWITFSFHLCSAYWISWFFKCLETPYRSLFQLFIQSPLKLFLHPSTHPLDKKLQRGTTHLFSWVWTELPIAELAPFALSYWHLNSWSLSIFSTSVSLHSFSRLTDLEKTYPDHHHRHLSALFFSEGFLVLVYFFQDESLESYTTPNEYAINRFI